MGRRVGELSEDNRVLEATAKAHVVLDVADWIVEQTHSAAPQIAIVRAIRKLAMDINNRKAMVED